MRIWLSGPRMFHGLVRPGVSFGREDFRRIREWPRWKIAAALGFALCILLVAAVVR